MQKYHFITSDQKEIKIYKEYLKNSATLNDLSEEYKLDKSQAISINFTYDEMKSFKEALQFQIVYNEIDIKIADFLNITNDIFYYMGENKILYKIDLLLDLDKEYEKFKKYIDENPPVVKHLYDFIIGFGDYRLRFTVDNTSFKSHNMYNKILQYTKHKNNTHVHLCSSFQIYI